MKKYPDSKVQTLSKCSERVERISNEKARKLSSGRFPFFSWPWSRSAACGQIYFPKEINFLDNGAKRNGKGETT